MFKPLIATTLCAASLAALHPRTARAARPFFTDDARVVDEGHCQLETFYKEQRAYNASEFWFLPACNPFGVELTAGGNRVEGERSLILQGKKLFKTLETNGSGYALSLGMFGENPYFNGIGSFSYLDDRAVIHANLGAIRDRSEGVSRGTWGIGLEALLVAPRLYGILESFGQRGDTPTQHAGLRFWVIPNRFQIDATAGRQSGLPERRFTSVGLRFLF